MNKNPFTQKGKTVVSFTTAPKPIEVVSSEEKVFMLQEAGTQITYVKDKLEFIKVYKEAFPAMRKLSSSGFEVLLYIFEILPPKKDIIFLYVPEIQEHCQYKNIKSVYQGIKNLLENDFISKVPKTSDHYFINSNYFYNGKRI